jgi:ubiquinone/menaquinone biosynthesis C-methylase UbiE
MDDLAFWNSVYSKNSTAKEHSDFAKKALEEIQKNKFKKILEIGFGDGRDTLFFSGTDIDITATDYSDAAVKKLQEEISHKKIKNVTCIIADTAKDLSNFKQEEFELIYAHLTLHYFDDKTTRKIFSEICRLLKHSGMLFARVKSTDDPLYGKGNQIEKDMFECGHTRHFFSEDYMKEMLKEFEIVSIRKEKRDYNTKTSSFISVVARKP